MKILGIETSCDETAAAIVEDGSRIISNVVSSQIDIHARYGGIVPEVASRQHVLTIIPVISQAMAEVSWQDISGIA
ncbi:MAG: tRNA (adenosine(37)-N6)-threonylcarbamoyltransferase complex transferase subunit TsaD, partial [Dehalococcoidia bacterium]|nr:tRNA (adenosine(37)-N6)-threonylcarbamoyltransferase complex transferase subunit TsaD [Dehalococcoidia bacterium]